MLFPKEIALSSLNLWFTSLWALIGGAMFLRPYLRQKFLHSILLKTSVLWLETVIVLSIFIYQGGSFSLLSIAVPTLSDMVWSFLVALITFLVMSISSFIFGGNRQDNPAMMKQVQSIAQLNIAQLLFLALTAGICEEIIYRGFALERIASATNSIVIGALISGIFFVWHHKQGWGLKWLIPVAVATVGLTTLYIFTRNLPTVILAHTLTDFFSFIVIKFSMHRYNKTEPH